MHRLRAAAEQRDDVQSLLFAQVVGVRDGAQPAARVVALAPEIPALPSRLAGRQDPADITGAGDSGRDRYTVRAAATRPPPAGTGTASRSRRTPAGVRDGRTKTARFLVLVAEEHGPLAGIPLGSVARPDCVPSSAQDGTIGAGA